jgi:hypothetical protein
MSIAYALRAEYEGTVEDFDGGTVPRFLGGILAVGPRSIDVRAELKAGGGTIVVDESDTLLVNVLDGYAPLKRVAAHDAPATISPYDGPKVDELRAEASLRDLATGGTKAELVARLEAHDEAVKTGDQAGASNPTPEA